MLTGSVASSLQGEPRATHDIDFVVAIESAAAVPLAAAFPPDDFYIEEAGILRAIRDKTMFNLIDTVTGDKVDFWILKDDPYDRSSFSRRMSVTFSGVEIAVSSPEDTILSKLRWAKLCGGSEKQFTDSLRVFEVQYARLDLEYLATWADQLGVEKLLAQIEEEAEIVAPTK